MQGNYVTTAMHHNIISGIFVRYVEVSKQHGQDRHLELKRMLDMMKLYWKKRTERKLIIGVIALILAMMLSSTLITDLEYKP